MRQTAVLAVGVAAALVLAGCTTETQSGAPPLDTETQSGAPPLDASALAASVTQDGVMRHLEELQRIADENDGNRASGTSGYAASVDYVAGILEDSGFDVQTPEFEFQKFHVNAADLTSDGLDFEVHALNYSPSTGPEGVVGRLVSATKDESPGCEATDYDGLDLTGAVVLVDRGVCTFADKQQVAADRGAAAVIVVNNEEGPLDDATLGDPGAGRIPTGGVSTADGAALEQAGGDVTLTLDTATESGTERNVIAQTKTGATDDVVMVGAHLDSVPDSPGMNDNGSGVSAILETAVQLGGSPEITNAVRFAFWGAEEQGLIGSKAYVNGLSDAERNDIALYMNFDMLGSENAAFLAYDGDDSDRLGGGPGPEGSAGIERTFIQFLEGGGTAVEGAAFDGRSDYAPFFDRGIPTGGVFSGAEQLKTDAQVQKWGGRPHAPFDPNYHGPSDTIDNVDPLVLAKNATAVAYAVGVYADSLAGPNGVPTGEDRVNARAGR
ncbi:amidohydrolase [Rhodococcus sp. WMMA185]|uniref:M28 family peptidase n=1 Tax=Rhodococcus sp. WMMA185 TaxID=679318 RepID=UPI00087A8C54|nr:M28 family peptidase [Rhodococcus sp. WMMA185]AOW93286.1 amidohydrolase [Rhodococcus sp. WMMA185]